MAKKTKTIGETLSFIDGWLQALDKPVYKSSTDEIIIDTLNTIKLYINTNSQDESA